MSMNYISKMSTNLLQKATKVNKATLKKSSKLKSRKLTAKRIQKNIKITNQKDKNEKVTTQKSAKSKHELCKKFNTANGKVGNKGSLLTILPNGIWNDPEVYKLSRSNKIIMTSYGAKNDTVYGLVNFSVTPRQFYSIFDKGWINGQIIDAYSATFITSWKNITYILVSSLPMFWVTFGKKRRSQKRLIHKIPAEFGDIILMSSFLQSLAIVGSEYTG